MASNTLTLDVLTPVGPAKLGADDETSLEIEGVEVPGVEGELGILPRHIPIVTPILPGVVRFKQAETSHRVAVGQGFLDVSAEGRVSILTNRFATADDVDVSAVKEELATLTEDVKSIKDDLERPEHLDKLLKLQWLEAQLRAADGHD